MHLRCLGSRDREEHVGGTFLEGFGRLGAAERQQRSRRGGDATGFQKLQDELSGAATFRADGEPLAGDLRQVLERVLSR